MTLQRFTKINDVPDFCPKPIKTAVKTEKHVLQ